MQKLSVSSFVLLLALFNFAYGIDEESAKENKCFEIKKTVPIDVQWLASQKTIYYPVMSRLDLYRTAAELSRRDFKDITEDELYYESCMTFIINSDGKFAGTGFNGKSIEFSTRPRDPGMEILDFGDEDGFHGTCYTTMTDNKSFVFMACCSNGDQMSWGAITTEKTLPKSTVKKIYKHAESLGFSKEQFTGIRYDSCDKKDTKEEL